MHPGTTLTDAIREFKGETWQSPAAQEPGWVNIEVVDRDGAEPKHFHQRFYEKTTGRLVQRGITQQAAGWPTPRARQGMASSFGQKDRGQCKIEEVTAQWATPRTITGGAESADRKQELGRTESGGGDLQAQAQQSWPTPRASEAEHSGRVTDDHGFQVGLTEASNNFPPAPRATGPASPGPSGPRSRKRLNTVFVSWLMGWTWLIPESISSGSWETESCPSKQSLPYVSS
jgi:hypothetical protein